MAWGLKNLMAMDFGVEIWWSQAFFYQGLVCKIKQQIRRGEAVITVTEILRIAVVVTPEAFQSAYHVLKTI